MLEVVCAVWCDEPLVVLEVVGSVGEGREALAVSAVVENCW